MAVFAIYKYDFRLAEEGSLFIKGTTDKLLDKAQEILNGFLTGDMPLPLQMPDHTVPVPVCFLNISVIVSLKNSAKTFGS